MNDSEKKADLLEPGLVPVDLISVDADEKTVISDTLQAEQEYTPQQYKKLLRKQDFMLLPIMWLCVSPAFPAGGP